MQRIQPQQDKPLQQGERRTVVWQNGRSSTESAPETLQEVLHDPHALIWLDILGDFPVLDDIDEIIDELEDVTVNSTSNDVQVRIFRIKRSLTQMRRVISPQVEVANALVGRTGKFIPAKAEPYFADVHDHLLRAFEVLDSYRDLMSGMLDVYLTTVSNRLNVVID
jgi:magnesium transporter